MMHATVVFPANRRGIPRALKTRDSPRGHGWVSSAQVILLGSAPKTGALAQITGGGFRLLMALDGSVFWALGAPAKGDHLQARQGCPLFVTPSLKAKPNA